MTIKGVQSFTLMIKVTTRIQNKTLKIFGKNQEKIKNKLLIQKKIKSTII